MTGRPRARRRRRRTSAASARSVYIRAQMSDRAGVLLLLLLLLFAVHDRVRAARLPSSDTGLPPERARRRSCRRLFRRRLPRLFFVARPRASSIPTLLGLHGGEARLEVAGLPGGSDATAARGPPRARRQRAPGWSRDTDSKKNLRRWCRPAQHARISPIARLPSASADNVRTCRRRRRRAHPNLRAHPPVRSTRAAAPRDGSPSTKMSARIAWSVPERSTSQIACTPSSPRKQPQSCASSIGEQRDGCSAR